MSKKKNIKLKKKKIAPKRRRIALAPETTSVENKGSLVASIFLFLIIFSICLNPTLRLMRVLLEGDGNEKLSWNYTVDNVKTKWAYASWDGAPPFIDSFSSFGLNFQRIVLNHIELPKKDHNIAGGILNIDGQNFNSGIGSHAPSKVAFDLNGKYASFSCVAGLDHSTQYDPDHGVVFSLICDGKEVSRTPMLRSDAGPYPLECSLVGVKELVLYADNMQFNNSSSNVDWADLKFTTATIPSR